MDEDYTGGGQAREIDQLRVNGQTLEVNGGGGYLSGANDQWSVVTFAVDTSLLRFPAQQGQVVTNDFQVLIDTGNGGQLIWAVEVDWAELRLVDDLLPSALIHGITGSGASMEDLKEFYEFAVPALQGKLINPSLTRNGSIAANAQMMEAPIATLLQDAGAAQLNLVAHSMGGLDSRLYAWDHRGQVRTVMMIATPNGGSQLADILCDSQNAPWWRRGIINEIIDENFKQMGECKGPENGLYQLQESYVQDVFNRQVLDAQSTNYFTIAGQKNGPASLLLDGEDDGTAVAVSSVRYLRPDSQEDPNPDHPGLHVPLYPAYEQTHSSLMQWGSEALPRSLCTVYNRQYPCTSDLYSGSGPAVAAQTTDTMELAANGSIVVPAGGTANVTLAVEASPQAAVVVLTGTTAVTATWKGQSMQATDVFGVPALALNSDGGTGTLALTNTGTADVPVLALAMVQTIRSLTITSPQELARVGSTTTNTLTLTGSNPDEQIKFQITNGAGTVVASGQAAHATGETWTFPFTPTAADTYTAVAWTEGQQARSGSAIVPVAAATGHRIQTIGVTDTGIDANGDGAYEAVQVKSQSAHQPAAATGWRPGCADQPANPSPPPEPWRPCRPAQPT